MDDMSFDLEGFDQVDKVLRKLPERMQERVVNSAVLSGLRVIRKAIEARAPVMAKPTRQRQPGQGRDNIKVKKMETGHYALRIGSKGYWMWFVEFGSFITGERFTYDRSGGRTKKGKKRKTKHSTGVMPAQPFIRPAFDESKDQALQTTLTKIVTGLDKEAEKLAGEFSKTGLVKK